MIYVLPFLAVLLSFGIILWAKPTKKDNFKLLLAFSGAFLLALTLFGLFPEVYSKTDAKTIGVFVMLGILLQIILEFFSKGAEHGHVHLSNKKMAFPWLLLVSLSIHAFLEGFPIKENETILYGIIIHKIPIALILGIFLVSSKINLWYSWVFMTIFALMTPLGTLFASQFDASGPFESYLNALVIGIFLHISTVILFESSEGHKFNARKLVAIGLGIGVAYFL